MGGDDLMKIEVISEEKIKRKAEVDLEVILIERKVIFRSPIYSVPRGRNLQVKG